MSVFPLGGITHPLPRAFDPERAVRGIEALTLALRAGDGPDGERLAAMVATAPCRELLAALFGNSPFLDQCILNEPHFAARLCEEAPETVLCGLLAKVGEARDATAAELMRELRIARRRLALLTAAADVAGYWRLEQVTHALSSWRCARRSAICCAGPPAPASSILATSTSRNAAPDSSSSRWANSAPANSTTRATSI